MGVLKGPPGLMGYVTWMTALVIADYTVPGLRLEIRALIALSGMLAIEVGVLRNRPAKSAPWLLIAAGNLCSVAGHLAQLAVTGVPLWDAFIPLQVAPIYAAANALYVLGFLGFIRGINPDRDIRCTIDALIMTLGLSLPVWISLIRPWEISAAVSIIHRSLAIAFPFGDLIVLGMLIRLLVPGTARGRAACRR